MGTPQTTSLFKLLAPYVTQTEATALLDSMMQTNNIRINARCMNCISYFLSLGARYAIPDHHPFRMCSIHGVSTCRA